MQDQTPAIPLFEAFPRLRGVVPWLSIGHWPTPVEHVRQFGAAMGLQQLYFKREDLSHPVCAGNKPRGLEFLLADAKARGSRAILTLSSAGSHHICRTAWHASQIGIRTIAVVLNQPVAGYVGSNIMLGIRSKARYVPANHLTIVPKFLWELCASRNRLGGRRPYFIPPGGTSPRSCLGHVNAAMELKRQIDAGVMPEPDYIYVPMGSLGTAAGLMLGCRLAGLRTRVVGVAVSYRWYCTPVRTARLAKRTLAFVRRHAPEIPNIELDSTQVEVVGTALGEGYACFTPEAAELAIRLRQAEGIQLDGTYTGKAFVGALRFIMDRGLQHQVHLFWHTYHALPPATPTPEEISRLPRTLRRYFTTPPQRFDAAFQCGRDARGSTDSTAAALPPN